VRCHFAESPDRVNVREGNVYEVDADVDSSTVF
jgi:hypothetical protein